MRKNNHFKQKEIKFQANIINLFTRDCLPDKVRCNANFNNNITLDKIGAQF